ncbi:hypothetical protein PoB_007711400 [Plakobranchus ocellatus]|uniref:Uncharacterized protein n=1 Tax=Plakobranchus ocellatus TaxID=259542 RepID=A0AAV4E336_9GAST|nr:hypothetical protein PoB_007711400 [Plakobranchus ocellatus]
MERTVGFHGMLTNTQANKIRKLASLYGDFRLSGPSIDQGADGRARARDTRRVAADFRVDPLSSVIDVFISSPNKVISDFKALPSGQGAGGGAQTRDIWVPADLRADSLAMCIVSPQQDNLGLLGPSTGGKVRTRERRIPADLRMDLLFAASPTPRKNVLPVHNKVISGFQDHRLARAPVAGLEPATERSLQISGRTP